MDEYGVEQVAISTITVMELAKRVAVTTHSIVQALEDPPHLLLSLPLGNLIFMMLASYQGSTYPWWLYQLMEKETVKLQGVIKT